MRFFDRGGRVPAGRPTSPQQQVRKKELSRSRKRLVTMSVFVIITLALTLVMIRMIMTGTAPAPQLFIIQQGTIVSEVYSEGIIARTENILHAPSGGMFEPAANNGDKVRKNALIGNVIKPSGMDYWNELEQVNLAISTRQLELMAEGQSTQTETDYLYTDQKLLPLVNQMRRLDQRSELYLAEQLATHLQVLMDERNSKLLSGNSDDSEIQTLLAKKDEVEANLSNHSTELLAPESGIIAFNPDSLAGTFDEAYALSASAADLRKLIEQKSSQPIPLAREVKQNESIIMLVKDIYQDFVFVMPGQKVENFPLDRTYTLILSDEGLEIPGCTLVSAKDDDGNLIAIFRTDSEVESLIAQRFIRAKIELESDRGLKVPLESLSFPDKNNPSVASVMVIRSGYVHEETVEVRKTDANYAIISSPIGAETALDVGTVIVQNRDSVKEGDSIGG